MLGWIVAAVLVGITMYLAKILRRPRDSELPLPMVFPDAWFPFLGHISMLRGNKIEGYRKLAVDGANEDGVSCFYVFSNMVVSVTKAEHVKEIVQSTSARLSGTTFDHHMERVVGRRSLLLLSGDDWKTHRHNLSRSFRWEHLKEMVKDMGRVANELKDVLLKHSGEEMDMWMLLKCATMDVIGLTAFGYEFGCVKSEAPSPVAEAFEFLSQEFKRRQFESPGDLTAYYYDIPTARNKEHARNFQIVRNTVFECIRKRREDIKNNCETHCDMLNYLLDIHGNSVGSEEGGDDKKIDLAELNDDETLIDNLQTMLAAGFDTSSISMSYILYQISILPDVEQRVLDEIHSVMGRDSKELPTYEQLTSSFPYCTAVVMETLRLFPPAPVTSRVTTKPVKLSGTTSRNKPGENIVIPKGTTILLPIWWINRSPFNYPSKPDEFDPSRFLTEQSTSSSTTKVVTLNENISRHAFMTFSSGARDCLGRRFALLELVMMLVVICREISFKSPPGYVLRPVTTGVVQKPEQGMPLVVSKRI